jgi:hypothetical protein
LGLINLPCKRENVEKPPRNSSWILLKRTRPKLGCGAKERRRMLATIQFRTFVLPFAI